MKFPRPFQGRLEGFWLAQLLGVLLLGLSFALIAGDSQTMLFSDQVMDAMFAGPIWGTTLARNLTWFALSLVLLHVLYATGCWLVGRLSAQAWPAAKATLRQHVTAWFLVLTIGLLANNAATYPESSLGIPYAQSMGATFLGLRLGRAILLVMLLCVAITVAMAMARRWKTGGRPAWRTYATLGALGAVYVAITAQAIHPAGRVEPSDKPNVILIGMDSLRADLVDERFSPDVTPHLEDVHEAGRAFTNALTPLARTFPSMMRDADRPASASDGRDHEPAAARPHRRIRVVAAHLSVPDTGPYMRWTKCASRTSIRRTVSSRPSRRRSAHRNS